MKKHTLFGWVALLLVLALAACGGGEKVSVVPTGDAASEGTSGSQPAATSAVEGAQATAETVAATAVTAASTEAAAPTEAAEADLDLESVSEGLAQLRSYKSKLAMRFTGKNASGEAVEKTWTMEEAFILEPRAQQIAWSGSDSTGGQAPTLTKWVTINVGGTSYMISTGADGTETCMAFSSEDSTPPEQGMSPDMWGSIEDARYVGTETVNGVRAKHYTWKEGALAFWGFAEGKAETWVAIDGGYVVKQKIEATGKDILMADSDEEGTTTWDWDVTEANGSFTIEPPAGCESSATGIPVMADAAEKTTFGDMISYTSPSAYADVVAFYKAEMPKAGWEASGTPTEMEGFASLEFTKDGDTASVMISWDASAGKTSVIVNVAKP